MLIVLKQTVLASLFDSILNVIASINVVASMVGWFFDMSWAGWLFGHGSSVWIACRVGIICLLGD
jgi:hypothetical protein